MNKDEALRLALEALEHTESRFHTIAWGREQDAITAIKAALEAKDEPMEFFDWYDNAHWGNEDFKEGCHRAWNAAIKYTAKPTQEANGEPVAGQCRFPNVAWSQCNVEHVRMVLDNPQDWKGYEVRYVYTTPPQRKPLTDETRNWIVATCPTPRHIIDAVERMHGIKGEA